VRGWTCKEDITEIVVKGETRFTLGYDPGGLGC
jgi:hypothetical protein